jgi:hypothetical protein
MNHGQSTSYGPAVYQSPWDIAPATHWDTHEPRPAR